MAGRDALGPAVHRDVRCHLRVRRADRLPDLRLGTMGHLKRSRLAFIAYTTLFTRRHRSRLPSPLGGRLHPEECRRNVNPTGRGSHRERRDMIELRKRLTFANVISVIA